MAQIPKSKKERAAAENRWKASLYKQQRLARQAHQCLELCRKYAQKVKNRNFLNAEERKMLGLRGEYEEAFEDASRQVRILKAMDKSQLYEKFGAHPEGRA
uniref:Uncharacterized protein n=1 Tax=Lotharella oceanica TaxID=641309 RepID=A0A7S2TPQ4_9EUKA|mmetsp:Transcript_21250/g.39832  ORF Transcript_21250/g.39832 Transcript_21250/m.39832 type:complete len:101 (+) Transcript_21250:3-305(+)